MINKKHVLASSAMVALLLAGCGNDSGDSSSEGSDDTTNLTFMFRGGPDEREIYESVVKEYEADNPGLKVEVIATDPDQYMTSLQASISGNDVPDVFFLEQGSVMAYVDNNILLDMTEKVDELGVDLDNIWEYGVDSYRYDGEQIGEGPLYALPKDVGPFALAYNKDIFEESGLEMPDKDVPYTWDEFVEVGKKLTNGEDQWATGMNVNWSIHSFIWSNGADWLSEDGKTVTVDTPEFAEALQYFVDIENKHNLTPSTEQAQTLDTYQRWMNGELAFFPAGPWDVSTFNDLDFEYDLMPWPAGSTGEPAAFIGSLGIAVAKSSENPDEAVELASYLSANIEGQQKLVDGLIQVPNLIDVAEEWASDTETVPNNKQEFLDIVQDYGRNLPAARTYTAEWYDEFFINIQPVLDGDQDVKEYLEEVQPKMQQLLDNAK
ncbi:ABC transporter substrate-binding protein [Marinilactibacillus kalidii]|uniref:ABC transporter substrate-binding protein n=1 Tax=Marinilactibacillus kalidii TaxID=2820274 RepID=UPI001ABEC276|nr:sugar ABC transporter substrate-binding protein [Marinilactibacillus kalidii]